MASRSCLASPFTKVSRARKSPERGCCKCPSQGKELSAAMPFSLSVTTTRPSALWCAIHGAQAGAKEAISPCLTLICLLTTFQTTFGQFASCINLTFNNMTKNWMINDRSQGGVGPDANFDGVTYW